jgi:Family of unknown function (DUF6263)
MKKLFVFLTAIIVILTSCNSSGEKYTLKPKMKAGESYTMEYKIDFDQDVMGVQNEMLMSMSYLMKIKDVNAQQEIEMDFMYNKMVMEMKSKTYSVSYNSDSTYLPNENENTTSESMRNIYAGTMGKLINKPIQITIDTTGQVKQVKGYRELVNSIQDSMPGANKPALNDMMSENQITQLFQQTFGTFPKKPVGIGEEWTNEINITQSSMLMKYTNTYKIIEILKKENEAIIDVKGIISMGMNPGGEAMKMDAKGTLTGNMVVDMNTGLVKTGKQQLEVKMEMEVMDKKVPMTMKGIVTLRGKKL